jgi:hypothetical protein
MPSVECGFADPHNAQKGQGLLALYGPTLWVNIGFDPRFKTDAASAPVPGITNVEALVDTGAEESCIDSALAAELHLPVVDRRMVCGVSGSLQVSMHLAQVHVPALRFTVHGAFAGVHLVAGGHRNRALLGRTFLRHFKMLYDGKTGAVTISS